MNGKVSADDWVRAGYAALCREGHGALKADVLAKHLKVSRGSFYWHFADIAAFHRAVIANWRKSATEAVIDIMQRDMPEPKRFSWLLRGAMSADVSAEVSMRAWAAVDTDAAGAVRAVDRRRRDYVAMLLRARGLSGERAQALATIYYWTYLGRAYQTKKPSAHQRDAIVDELLSLAQ